MSARSRQLSVYLVFFCLMVAGCGGGDGEDSSPQPTTTSPSTTQSQEADDEQALRRLAGDLYEAIEDIYAGEAEVQAVSDFLTDPYLSGFEEQVRELRESGHKTLRDARSGQEILEVAVDGDNATVQACVVDAAVLVAADGTVINNEVNAQLLETDAVRTPEGWRFSERRLISEQKGSEECA